MRSLPLIVLVVFLSPEWVFGQPAAEVAAALDAVVARFEEGTPPFNGVLLVGNAEGVLYERASGYANFELKVPIASGSKFRMASLSKQFAGLLAVLLAEEGRVDLQAPVETYVPRLAGSPAGAVTLHQLLTHTSGLPNDRSYLWDHVVSEYKWNWRQNRARDSFSPDAFLDSMAAEAYESNPGSNYQYCNACYVLAGLALGEAAGSSYDTLLQERILNPLGMKDTGLEQIDAFIENKAYPYEWAGEGPYPISRFRNLYPLGPAGAMYATIGDMQRWAEAVFHADLLISSDVRKRFLPEQPGYFYGLTRSMLNLGGEQEVDFIWHTGQIAGTYALLGYLPDQNIHLIVLSNIGFTFPQQNFMQAVVGALVGVM